MLPVESLIMEHRLIERMIALMEKEVRRIRQGLTPDTEFILAAADFIQTYADRLHHGKEEDILFKEFAAKPLSPEHRKVMEELIKEHALGRKNTQAFIDARKSYLAGDKNSARVIADNMDILVKFYPRHIEKEDHRFFVQAMEYFTPDEQLVLLARFNELDRKFIHAVYRDIVSGWETHQSW